MRSPPPPRTRSDRYINHPPTIGPTLAWAHMSLISQRTPHLGRARRCCAARHSFANVSPTSLLLLAAVNAIEDSTELTRLRELLGWRLHRSSHWIWYSSTRAAYTCARCSAAGVRTSCQAPRPSDLANATQLSR